MTDTNVEDYVPNLVNGALKLYDGRILDIESGEIYKGELAKVPNHHEQRAREALKARRLLDIPTPPSVTHPIAVILFYKSLGVSDEEISDVLNVDVERLHEIMAGDDYNNLRAMFFEAVTENDMQDVTLLLKKHSYDAIKGIIDTMADDSDPDLQFKARKDVADRAGFRPADKVQHQHQVNGGLNIRYITDDSKMIDLNAVNAKEN